MDHKRRRNKVLRAERGFARQPAKCRCATPASGPDLGESAHGLAGSRRVETISWQTGESYGP